MNSLSEKNKTHCGYIAIIGRPNVGKSTLLNNILEKKISITSAKPQTTRHQILGIKTIENSQYIFVDTPGIHQMQTKILNRYMNKAATSIIEDVDVVVFMVEELKWKPDDSFVLEKIQQINSPVLLVVNKIDRIPEKEKLLPYLKELSQKLNFVDVIPISAEKGINVDALLKSIGRWLPESPFMFSQQQITDRSERFLIAEIIREKLTRILAQELPYETTVEIEALEKGKSKNNHDLTTIHAIIWVDRQGQKPIILGSKGERIKKVGTLARGDIANLLETKIFLHLWVKVKQGWSDSEKALRSLGYE